MIGHIYTGSDRYFTDLLCVRPDTFESRLVAVERYRKAMEFVNQGHINFVHDVQPPKEPMTPEEVAVVAQDMKRDYEEARRYKQLGRLGKFGQNVLLAMGRDSIAPSPLGRGYPRLPDIIQIKTLNDSVQEIIVRLESEEIYRSLPPNNWRRTDGSLPVSPRKK